MCRISRGYADTGIDPSKQVVLYDAGLGTDIGATALTAPVRFVQNLLGSVTSAGIKRNIADRYEFIVNHYEDGDRNLSVRLQPRRIHGPQPGEPADASRRPTKTPSRPLMRYRKAVYFIGVFEPRRGHWTPAAYIIVIQAGLAAGISVAASTTGFVLSVVIATLYA
jgi:Uncharacterized alpha/beta hydrolase domain (DUF2235)